MINRFDPESNKPHYVNLGCGRRYLPDWTNIDLVSAGPDVIKYDLRKGIPLPNNSCDLVYHSHVIEHLRRRDALQLMKECHRVLKSGGHVRVVTPDLERIARIYLEKLDLAFNGDKNAAADYQWMMIELYDQAVREETGGDMLAHLSQAKIPNLDFVLERIGAEGKDLLEYIRHPEGVSPNNRNLYEAGRANLRRFLRTAKQKLVAGIHPLRIYEVGRLRFSGEVHKWMYDRYSLAKLMLSAGFQDPIVQTALKSKVPGWSSFHLDTGADGQTLKPDSLFMEATKQ